MMTRVTPKYRLLLVDDEATILFAMRVYFENLGYQVDCAREAAEAQALISAVEYAVAIIDLRMTGTHGAEGLEITSTVKELSPSTQVILLTAYGSEDLAQDARSRGAATVLAKPQPLASLAALVAELIRRSPDTEPRARTAV